MKRDKDFIPKKDVGEDLRALGPGIPQPRSDWGRLPPPLGTTPWTLVPMPSLLLSRTYRVMPVPAGHVADFVQIRSVVRGVWLVLSDSRLNQWLNEKQKTC